jgi:hypothetical protein
MGLAPEKCEFAGVTRFLGTPQASSSNSRGSNSRSTAPSASTTPPWRAGTSGHGVALAIPSNPEGLVQAALAAAEPAAQRSLRGLRARVVLHVDDHAAAQLEQVRPLVPLTFGVPPREDDRDPATALGQALDLETVVAVVPAPLERRRESLTGLVWAVSGGRRSPEPPALPLAAPLHLRVHQPDEWLDIAVSKRLVRGTNGVHRAILDRSVKRYEPVGYTNSIRVPVKTLGSSRLQAKSTLRTPHR